MKRSKLLITSALAILSCLSLGACDLSGLSNSSNDYSSYYNQSQTTQNVSVTGISLSDSSVTLDYSKDKTYVLNATVLPTNATNKAITFYSGDTRVVEVNSTGVVTVKGIGSAYVYAQSVENASIVSSCYFIITDSSTPVVNVTNISVNPSSKTVEVGESFNITATLYPSNATNQQVTWSTSNGNVAMVNNGYVTTKKAGTANIIATSVDGNKTASCYVTVNEATVSVTSVVLDKDYLNLSVGESYTLSATVLPTTASNKNVTWSSSKSTVASVTNGKVTAVSSGTATITVKTVDGNKTDTCTVEVKAQTVSVTSVSLNTSSLSLTVGQTSSLTATVYPTNATNKNVTWSSSNPSVATVSSSGLVTAKATGSATITVRTEDGNKTATCSVTVSSSTVSVTGVIISSTSLSLTVGQTSTLSATVLPTNATNKNVTWSSNNTSVATVSSSGLVTAKATGSATITVTTVDGNKTDQCNVTVTNSSSAGTSHTVLIYICGADLESGYASSNQGLATADIKEILSVSGQPDDVNIVIETGGANSWSSTYGINASYLQRHHVSNKKLVTDASLTYASMGLSSTLQSFIEYGISNFPADKYGLVLWNHGGGMYGVCYDEKKNNDSLLNSEVKTAVANAMSNLGMNGQKLEWIGYDACLMQVQDIAEFNSKYFNYMVASEESEAGYGWEYNTWVDDLYAKKSTPTMLQAICDGFISSNGGTSSSNNQTLSYLDLTKMSSYKTAWENMASALKSKLTSSNRSSFNNAIKNNVQHYADNDYDYFCLFDAKDFINSLASVSAFSSFRIDSSYTNAVINAFNDLIAYSSAQRGAGDSYGLCMYWPNSTSYSDVNTVYSTSQTNFTTWRTICVDFGYHY